MPASDPMQTRRDIIETCRRMNAIGINQGTSGNVSARAGGGFLITGSGIDYEAMQPDDVVSVGLDGAVTGPVAPSSEWRMHRDIYTAFPEARAVVHTHSPHATALSCLRAEIPPFHYMIAVAGGPTLRCAEYATFGTQALSHNMLAALEGRRACLLANHGMICHAPTLEKALALAVEVEALCQQYAIARMVGEPVILDDEEMARVVEKFKTYGQQPRRD